MDKWRHRKTLWSNQGFRAVWWRNKDSWSLGGFMPSFVSTIFYVLCPLLYLLFPLMYVFVCQNENITSFEGRWVEWEGNVKVSWEGDKAGIIRHLLSFFTYIIYCTHFSIPVNISPDFTGEDLRFWEILLVAQGHSDGKLDSLDTMGKMSSSILYVL